MSVTKYSLSAAFLAWGACTSTLVQAQGPVVPPSTSHAEPARPSPILRPEARPDQVTVEAGERKRIDVLANDERVSTDPSVIPEVRVDGPVACGTASIEGRFVVYQGGDACVGQRVTFDYSANLQNEWVTGQITVTVKPRVIACDIPNPSWQLIRIEGGRFDKSNVPPGVVDFADLLDETTFTVGPFCLILEPVLAEDVEKFFGSIPEEQRREQFPEIFETAGTSFPTGEQNQRAPATKISRRMAEAYVKQKAEATARNVTLPTLNEYVAAAWELQAKRSNARETNVFLVALRSGGLQWTSTPCGPSGSFWTIGPSAQGPLTKLCYEQSRRDRTGFRLVVK
ncbi:MAG: hypothetical protein GHHEDOFH_00858 [Pseudorhodoplanes sp.]|nr:hypothetical protein [Pseudorhodoplanes sp.]